MRLTRRVFHDLAIWQVVFGLSIGVVFPFFVLLLGVPQRTALTAEFFGACLAAGAVVGIVNWALAHRVVGRRLRTLAGSMHHVAEGLKEMTASGDVTRCTPEACSVVVDSDDEIGESARAFNHLVDALADSMRTQAAVRSFSEMLTSQLEIKSLAGHALVQFCEYTGAAGGLVLYESGGELKVAAARGLRDPQAVAASGHVRAAHESGKPLAVRVPDDVSVDGVVADFRPAEVLIYPVTYKGVPLGTVVLAASTVFAADDRARAELFLHGLGLALNNAVAHERLQTLVALDPLTGIYNRRFGLGRLREEFGRAVRGETPIGVLMFDLDHFKAVNDTYGHLVGDRLLKSVSAIARSLLREGDVLLRYGGEEFLAVLPAACGGDLLQMGERIRRAVEDGALRDGERTVRVTVSVGAAAYPDHRVENEEGLVRLADEALYRAKEAGRNRVEVA